MKKVKLLIGMLLLNCTLLTFAGQDKPMKGQKLKENPIKTEREEKLESIKELAQKIQQYPRSKKNEERAEEILDLLDELMD